MGRARFENTRIIDEVSTRGAADDVFFIDKPEVERLFRFVEYAVEHNMYWRPIIATIRSSRRLISIYARYYLA